jgi:hypothetical protein
MVYSIFRDFIYIYATHICTRKCKITAIVWLINLFNIKVNSNNSVPHSTGDLYHELIAAKVKNNT